MRARDSLNNFDGHAQSPWTWAGFSVLYFCINPTGWYPVIGLVAIVLLVGALRRIRTNGWGLGRVTTLSGAVAIAAGAIWTIVGALNSTPGWKTEGLFFLAVPLVCLVIVGGGTRRDLASVSEMLPIAAALTAGGQLLFYYSQVGVLPVWLAAPFHFFGDVGVDTVGRGYGPVMRFDSIGSLVFLGPFVVLAIGSGLRFTTTLSRRLLLPSLFLVVIATLLSGRRALIFTLLVSVVVSLALLIWRNRRRVRAIAPRACVFVVAVGLGVVLSGFSPVGYSSNLWKAPTSTSSSSGDALTSPPPVVTTDTLDLTRQRQYHSLVNDFRQTPVIGRGFGFESQDWVSNPEKPWQYELQYVLLLAAMGWLGVIFLLAPTAWVTVFGYYTAFVRSTHFPAAPALMAGFTSVLIANATNPYLHTPGRYWMFFVVVLLVGLSESQNRASLAAGRRRKKASPLVDGA